MNDTAMLLRQVRYENKSFWRNPPAAFFTFAFPLLFLVLFNLLFGHGKISYFGHRVNTSTFYVPAIAAFSVITATFTNLAMNVTFAREQGVLKRKRGTPMPPLAFLSAKILHSGLMSLLLVAIIIVFGRLFYGVSLPHHTWPAFLVSLLVGALSFCAMGLAITAAVPNADAAPAVVNAVIFPLLFISDIFIPLQNAPKWLTTVAKIFPIYHFSWAMQHAFNPFQTGSGFQGTDLLIVAAWGVGALLVAARFFTWEPRQ
ncbi:MAG TPA: ABC transporter permease [Actinomycetota bacterium]|nr:ABC transporter permease [Actinomycetota bacterium]